MTARWRPCLDAVADPPGETEQMAVGAAVDRDELVTYALTSLRATVSSTYL